MPAASAFPYKRWRMHPMPALRRHCEDDLTFAREIAMASHTSLRSSGFPQQPRRRTWLVRSACAALLGLAATGAHAASVYKCVDAHGGVSFRDTPCATNVQQTQLDADGQPLIDPDAPRVTSSIRVAKPPANRARAQTAAVADRKHKPATSWECHAADGEVFYHHARCPGSVAGDGVARSAYAEKTSSVRKRGRHDAWSQVPVHGRQVSRAEACRRMRGAEAAGRDGHQRDDDVSTYARLTGHDPCNGG